MKALYEKLAHQVELSVQISPERLRIRPTDPTGFSIEVTFECDEWIAYCGDAGVHAHFDDPQGAFDFVMLALSPEFELFEVWEDGQYRYGGTGPRGTGKGFYKGLRQVRRFTNNLDPANSGFDLTVELIRVRESDGARAVLDRIPLAADDLQKVIPRAKRFFETADLPQKPDGLRILDDRGGELFSWRPESND